MPLIFAGRFYALFLPPPSQDGVGVRLFQVSIYFNKHL